MSDIKRSPSMSKEENRTSLPPPVYAESESQYSESHDSTAEYYIGGMLEKPIVVPQQTSLFMIKTFSPFARAYSPALAKLPEPISKEQFLEFIDGLNNAFISSPIFQLAHVVGGGLLGSQILPAQAVGAVFQVSSVALSAGVSVVRVRSFLKKANADIFAPKKLIARLMNTKKMMEEIKCNNVDAKGKLILPPMDELTDLTPETGVMIVRDPAVAAPAPTVEDPRVRRLRALDGYISPLELESEAPLPEGVMKKYGGAPLRWLNKRRDTKLAKAATMSSEKRLSKAPEAEAEMERSEAEIQNIERRMIEVHHAAEMELATATPEERLKIEARSEQEISALKASRDVETERRNTALAAIYKKGDKKLNKLAKNEEKIANRILWIVITKLGANNADSELMEVGSLEADSEDRPRSQ
ncbi:unnamed protein product [Diplocarpon coronariae]|uniref:Uncharacterized protein n=1 Tax=Diplocarpon coronariae TaxID=2795749 RepID=A0A218Z8J2_9HELO|nr:hypothetical protein JHW43_007710 [Diplocarpon mali]OWP03863.1 hypothetical protein B2J93_3345 [Marssonina coronariae]